MTVHRIYGFQFVADLHTPEGRSIARAAHVELRTAEIDNEWKDTIGRGTVGDFWIGLGRTNTDKTWSLRARSNDADYDREVAEQLRAEVLAALEENAEEFQEFASELYEPPSQP